MTKRLSDILTSGTSRKYCAISSHIGTSLVLDALLMALWRRRPEDSVMVHSDQGSQFTGHECQTFLREHDLVSSMSRRGNCLDNAVAESFFQLFKRERVRRQIYATRCDARADVFNYIEMFYNPKRRHGTAGRYFAGRVRTTPFPKTHGCLGNPGRFSLTQAFEAVPSLVIPNALCSEVLIVCRAESS
jgi:hypothetical protein